MIDERMKKKVDTRQSSCLRILIFSLSSIATIHHVCAEPEPLPSVIFSETFADDSENFMLLEKLKRVAQLQHEIIKDERELTETRLEIERLLRIKTQNQRMPHHLVPAEFSGEAAEMLPVPSAVVHHGPTHSGKRTSYMALCHFKICNMGRKRQL